METDEKGESGLRDFLTELPETLRVDMIINGEHGRFWFPEFFEEGVENTPARILENHVHGSGIRYRNSFVHKKLNTLEYDRLFPYAVAWDQRTRTAGNKDSGRAESIRAYAENPERAFT